MSISQKIPNRIPPLEINFQDTPQRITIFSENLDGKKSEITIDMSQIETLVKWLKDWEERF